ncbi:hypothetical protein CR513_29996, partial [Mucuna pruriens]
MYHGEYTFVDAMLDLGALINVMPTLVYKSLNFGDLEPTRMIIQLANRSIVKPLGVLEDVLVQANELIFPANFYMLDIEDKTSEKGTLTEDHTLFGIDVIDELVAKHLQLEANSAEFQNFVEDID